MSYTMEDFHVDYIVEHLPRLPRDKQHYVLKRLAAEVCQAFDYSVSLEDRRRFLESFTVEERLADLTEEQIRQYLEQLTASRPATPRKPKRKRQ